MCVRPSKDTSRPARRTIDEWHIINVAQATHGHMHLHHIPLLRAKYPYRYRKMYVQAYRHRSRAMWLHVPYISMHSEGHASWPLKSYIAVCNSGVGFGNACLLQVLFAQPTRNFAMTRNIKNEATHTPRLRIERKKHKTCIYSPCLCQALCLLKDQLQSRRHIYYTDMYFGTKGRRNRGDRSRERGFVDRTFMGLMKSA